MITVWWIVELPTEEFWPCGSFGVERAKLEKEQSVCFKVCKRGRTAEETLKMHLRRNVWAVPKRLNGLGLLKGGWTSKEEHALVVQSLSPVVQFVVRKYRWSLVNLLWRSAKLLSCFTKMSVHEVILLGFLLSDSRYLASNNIFIFLTF
jgi:hypothetical protein